MTACCPNCGLDLTSRRLPLTRKQFAIFAYLERYIADNGFAPSFEEIAREFRYNSLATVHEHLATMQRKGVIERSYNESRAITFLVRTDDLRDTVRARSLPTGRGL